MDMLLIIVTILSLAMAAAMALVVLKLLREERLRSDAAAAALQEMSAAAPEPRRRTAPAAPAAPKRVDVHAREGARRESPARRRARDIAGDLPLRPALSSADLFAQPEPVTSWGPRLGVAAAVLVVLAAIGLTVASPGRTAAGPAGSSPAPAALELLTLRHSAEAGSLTVSGLVQNPRSGAPLTRVVATAFAIGSDGALVATGRAPLDVTTLGAGEESPFVVTIPVDGPVARYRIGFRAEDGGVIAHVGRRSGLEALAQK